MCINRIVDLHQNNPSSSIGIIQQHTKSPPYKIKFIHEFVSFYLNGSALELKLVQANNKKSLPLRHESRFGCIAIKNQNITRKAWCLSIF
jgi:hypothetical protein